MYDYVANAVGDYDMVAQVTSQLWGVGTVIVWSGVVSFICYKIVDYWSACGYPKRGARRSRHHGPRRIGLPLLIDSRTPAQRRG